MYVYIYICSLHSLWHSHVDISTPSCKQSLLIKSIECSAEHFMTLHPMSSCNGHRKRQLRMRTRFELKRSDVSRRPRKGPRRD